MLTPCRRLDLEIKQDHNQQMWSDHQKTAESTLSYIKDIDEEMNEEINELNRKRKFSQISQKATVDHLN